MTAEEMAYDSFCRYCRKIGRTPVDFGTWRRLNGRVPSAWAMSDSQNDNAHANDKKAK